MLYTVVMVLLLGFFKGTEWLVEHHLSVGKNLGIPMAIGIAVVLAVIFQLSHKRVEHAVSEWLNRAAHTREHELKELAQEVSLIRDPRTLHERVVSRLDQILATKGCSLYLTSGDSILDLAAGPRDELPIQVRVDDPALIHALLQRAPTSPKARGSGLPMPMIWPIIVRGRMTGFVGAGQRENESLDSFEVSAIGAVADAAGNALAILSGDMGSPVPLPDKPSIAVLPFQTLGGDSRSGFLADGAVEEITTALSRFNWLFVIARTSSFTYKGRTVDIKQVGRELGVRYVLEGSVRESAGMVRITGQLIDAANSAHLWADRFDGPMADVFALQDQVTAGVVGAIMPKLEEAEIRRIGTRSTQQLDAYAHYIRGLATFYEMTKEASDRTLESFRAAIRLDPLYGLAYARASHCFAWRRTNGYMNDRAAEVAEGCAYARRAIELARDDAVVLASGGFALARLGDDLDTGNDCIERALSLNPNVADAWASSGWIQICLGNPDKAIEHVMRAIRLSPLDPVLFRWKFFIGQAHLYAGRYSEAAEWTARSLALQPNFLATVRVSACANALAGNMDVARAAIAHLLECDPTVRLSNVHITMPPSRSQADRELWMKGLRLAGLPE